MCDIWMVRNNCLVSAAKETAGICSTYSISPRRCELFFGLKEETSCRLRAIRENFLEPNRARPLGFRIVQNDRSDHTGEIWSTWGLLHLALTPSKNAVRDPGQSTECKCASSALRGHSQGPRGFRARSDRTVRTSWEEAFLFLTCLIPIQDKAPLPN